MQNQKSNLFSGKSGHRRRASLGKAMPVMDLLMNSTPLNMSSMHLSYVSDGRAKKYLNVEDFEKEAVATIDEAVEIADEPDADLDLEVLVSDCSDDGSDNEGKEKFAIAGSSNSYTPCLSCTGAASNELLMRPIAINEMCRKLCTEDCRLRLSLAGYEPPSEAALRSTEALSVLLESNSFKAPQKPSTEAIVTPEEHPIPSTIDLQRQKFLTAMLNEPGYDKNMSVTPSVDSRESNILKDFREKVEIAEALARTSAMTSTSQIKQRLAARKLEIEMDEANLLATTSDIGRCASQGVPAAAADAYRSKTADDLAMQNGSDYEPPRELLLYLVR